MWIIDIRHWIDEETEEAAAPQLSSNVKGLKEVIHFATSKAAGIDAELPRCWHPENKRCDGYLIAEIVSPERIHWACTVCEFEGEVSGWRELRCNNLRSNQKRLH